MTAKLKTSGSNLILTLEHKAPAAKMTAITLAAAGYLWEHG